VLARRPPEKIGVARTPGETGTVHPMPDDIDIPATPEQVRAAVAGLKSALDAHLAAVEARAGENDPNVQAAYDALASAGEAYDDALFSAYEEVTPFGPVESEDDEDDEADADAEEDDDLEWEAPEAE
jgi:hypothetical protein